jgi:uncharacterized damage-inducible protein DinB
MCHAQDRNPDYHHPSDKRDEVNDLLARLHQAQRDATQRIQASATFEGLGDSTPDGFTVNDTLRMWVWHFWAHHRDLVRARGPLTNDNPHFHVPHFVRQAHEEFGKFAGELACLSDEYLDVRPLEGGRTIRETVEHVIGTLEGYIPDQVERATPKQSANKADASDA